MDGWWDLSWSSKAIHIIAPNQTKWYITRPTIYVLSFCLETLYCLMCVNWRGFSLTFLGTCHAFIKDLLKIMSQEGF